MISIILSFINVAILSLNLELRCFTFILRDAWLVQVYIRSLYLVVVDKILIWLHRALGHQYRFRFQYVVDVIRWVASCIHELYRCLVVAIRSQVMAFVNTRGFNHHDVVLITFSFYFLHFMITLASNINSLHFFVSFVLILVLIDNWLIFFLIS